LSGKRFGLAPGAFGFFSGVYAFGKKIEDGIAVFTIKFVDGHGRSSFRLSTGTISIQKNNRNCLIFCQLNLGKCLLSMVNGLLSLIGGSLSLKAALKIYPTSHGQLTVERC
jgi:hypothetical protein